MTKLCLNDPELKVFLSQIYFIENTRLPTEEFLFLYLLKYHKAASSQTATKDATRLCSQLLGENKTYS